MIGHLGRQDSNLSYGPPHERGDEPEHSGFLLEGHFSSHDTGLWCWRQLPPGICFKVQSHFHVRDLPVGLRPSALRRRHL